MAEYGFQFHPRQLPGTPLGLCQRCNQYEFYSVFGDGCTACSNYLRGLSGFDPRAFFAGGPASVKVDRYRAYLEEHKQMAS